MNVSRTAGAALLAALLLPLAAACGSSPSHRSATARDAAATTGLSSVTLRIGQTGWASAQAALKVAGLDHTPYKVSWDVFAGGDKQLQALQAGALDAASSSDIPPVFAAAGTAPKWRVVAVQRSNTLLQDVLAGRDSAVTGIAQLKGRKVGYVPATTAQYFLYKLLRQAGLRWSDIHAVPLTPQDGVAALSSGAVDALATYGDSVVAGERQGARVIGSGADILSGDFPWEASTGLLADPARSAALADLLARVNRAYAYVRAGHESAYAKLTATATDEPFAEALGQTRDDEKQTPTVVETGTPAQIAREQDVADAFAGLGVLPHRVSVASYWSDALDARLAKALSAS